MDAPTYEGLLKSQGLTEEQMKVGCSDAVMTAVAEKMWNNKPEDYLSLGEEFDKICSGPTIATNDKPRAYLEKWKMRLCYAAKCDKMAIGFMEAKRGDLAIIVCEEVKRSLSEHDPGMASLSSYDEILKHYELPDGYMGDECSETVMTAVSKKMSGLQSDYLLLGEDRFDAIEKSGGKEEEKWQKYLKVWKGVYGSTATYELMVNSFLKAERADLVQIVCEELQKMYETYTDATTTTDAASNTEMKATHKEPSSLQCPLNPETDGGRSDGERSPTESIDGMRQRKKYLKLDTSSEQDPNVANLTSMQEPSSQCKTPVSAGANEVSNILQHTFAHVQTMTRMILGSKSENYQKIEEFEERNRQARALLDEKDKQITKLQEEAQQLQQKLDEEHKQLKKANEDLLEMEWSKDVDQQHGPQMVEELKAKVMKLKKTDQGRRERRIGHLKENKDQVNMEMASTKKEREEIERFQQITTADIEAKNEKLEIQEKEIRRYKLLATVLFIALFIVLVCLFLVYYSPYFAKENFSLVLYT